MTRVLPVTPEGKRYQKNYYSDRKGSDGGGDRSGREDIERPTTSGHTTSLRERHGFSPVRRPQARPSTAAPTTSNRENLAMYLQRMERILAEVQATHTDLISRRNKRKGHREKGVGVGSEVASGCPSYRKQPAQVETVPLDIGEILADASIESASPSPVRSPSRRLRSFLESPSPNKKTHHRTPIRERLSRRTPDRNNNRRRMDTASERSSTARWYGDKNNNDYNSKNEGSSIHIARPGTASRRSSALRKLRKVSARNRSVRQSDVETGRNRKQQQQQKKKVESPEHEGVIAVTSSTFCLKPGQLQGKHAWNRRSYSQSPEEAVRQTTANMAEVLLKDEKREGPLELDSESVRQAVLGKLDAMEARVRASLAANLKRALVRRRLNSKLGRSVVADIKHLVELIDGCSDQKSSSSSFQDKQLEQKMKVQFTKDLALKKQELAKLVSTSQALAPRVLKKPSVPVTPLKRISKSLRIRNRPGTAPAAGGGSRNNATAENKKQQHPPSATGNHALGQRRTAWGGESERNSSDEDRQQQQDHPSTKKEDAKKKDKNKSGRTTTRSKSRSGSLVKEDQHPALDKTSTAGTPSDELREESSLEGPAKGQEETKKAFLKRKRPKIKMYKIPNYSHVKSVVDSRHEDDLQDEQQAQDTFMYSQARPSTAPPMQTQQQEKPTASASPLAAQQNDSPIDDLKKILGLKQNSNSPHGKENALPRSSAARKGHSRRWKGKSVSSSTHLNISGTVARLFSSSVQKARESILTFEQTDIDAENEISRVPRAVQKFNQAGEEQIQSGSTSSGASGKGGRGERGEKYQYGAQYNLRKLVEQPELVEKIKSETRNLEDFVKPRELSFVHLDTTRD